MQAVLWDGNKKLMGELIFGTTSLQFRMADFNRTDLNFDLPFSDIKEVKYHKLYALTTQGIEILSHNNTNVFIVADPQNLMQKIESFQGVKKIK